MAPPIAAPPDGAPLQPTDIAGTAEIKATRQLVADTSSRFFLDRLSPEQRAAAGGTLSAAELAASRAAERLLVNRPDLGEGAGAPRDVFQRTLDADLALCSLGRVAGQIEATAAIGEMVLSARLTEQNDRVFAATEAEDATADERAAYATYLASADVIYERQDELRQGRKARAALRRDRQAAELSAPKDEAKRLRARERLQGGALPGRDP